ncbi:MAG: hypothetical protein GY819_13805, partial [Planctomycetaceae bacterium]|nr:hypothetical protein [Planctomycetaceae bacterium]
MEAPTTLGWMFPNFDEPIPHDEASVHVALAKREMQRAHDLVRHNLNAAQKRQARQFNKKVHGENIHQVGDFILIFTPVLASKSGQVRKFRPSWVGPYKVLEVIGRNYRINSQPKEKIVNWENTRPFEGRPGLLILGSEDGIDLDWDRKTIPAPGSQSAYSEDAPGQVACPEERAGIEPSERRQYDLRARGDPQYREEKDDDSFLWSDTNPVEENYADFQVQPGQLDRDPGSTTSG